ncbi:recombination regulator RecX [Pseudonocardia sp. N23]|uniref:recombination regulator RecX n=1 Tax=Pseudonocardia sp. N23 TaxID=1987376 RepID=UPI00278BE5E8|nr:recombination regulator RecX [Pseudonocardia sp. N23]
MADLSMLVDTRVAAPTVVGLDPVGLGPVVEMDPAVDLEPVADSESGASSGGTGSLPAVVRAADLLRRDSRPGRAGGRRSQGDRTQSDRSQVGRAHGGRRRGPGDDHGRSAPAPEDAPTGSDTADGRDPDGPREPDRARGRRSTRGGRSGERGRRSGPPEPPDDPVAAARTICLRQLEVRSRTRKELADVLRRKGIPDDAADQVLERFGAVGLIDDKAFADQWVHSRHTYSGLGRRAIAVELRRKGVDSEAVGEALSEIDDASEEARARALVDRKLRTRSGVPDEAMARRLLGMLARKGYPAGIAYRVVKEAVAEHAAELADQIPETDD